MASKPVVSSLSMAFKRATQVTEDREEAKKEHRQTLKDLMTTYIDDIQSGKAVGIRNAKELVEVMKMDLLLMGEATERTDNVNEFDEIRVQQISKVIDLNQESMRGVMAEMLKTLNDTNDNADIGTNKKTSSDELSSLNGTSIMADSDALEEIANQAMQSYMDNQGNEDDEDEDNTI